MKLDGGEDQRPLSRRQAAFIAVAAGALAATGIEVGSREFKAETPIVVAKARAEVIDVMSYGADNSGRTDSSKEIQAALDAGARSGLLVIASGIFRVDDGITIRSSIDFSGASIAYRGRSTAIRVGGNGQRALDVMLPQVSCATKSGLGWKSVSGTIGVYLTNLYSSRITIPAVQSFDRGLVISGVGRNGIAYCTMFVGHLDNNRVNLHLTGETGGWANQNTFVGGRWSHNSGEGRNVVGTRHILCTASAPDNNTWLNPSLESPGVVEFAIDMDSGRNNLFLSPRFENTLGYGTVRWGSLSERNMIVGGFGLDTLRQVRVPGERGNSLFSPDAATLDMRGGNGLSLVTAGNAISVGQFDDLANFGEQGTFGPFGLTGRASADQFNRVEIMFGSGQLRLGNGMSQPVAGVDANGGILELIARVVEFSSDNVTDVGSGSSRARYVRAGTAIVTGAGSTKDRPDARSAGVGAMIYDTTLSLPLWSDGHSWRDAAGVVR